MGDFNDDIFKCSNICKHLLNKEFIQIVKQATTENGTLIDHVYAKTTNYNAEAIVLPSHFSDHQGILCSVSSKRTDQMIGSPTKTCLPLPFFCRAHMTIYLSVYRL